MKFSPIGCHLLLLELCSRARRSGRWISTVSLAILVSSIPLLPTSAIADAISLGADNWCPYTCDPSSDHPGLLVEIARYSFEKAGHTVVFKVMPWSRAIQESREGRLDGIVGAFSADVPDFVFPSVPQLTAENRFFVSPKNSWRFTGLESLSSIALGVVQDYHYEPKLDEYIVKFSRDPSRVQVAKGDDPIATNIEKLLAGRIGTFLDDDKVVKYILTQRGTPDALIEAGSLESANVFIAFSPKIKVSATCAKILSDGTREMRENGELAKLERRYGINPIPNQ